MVRKFFNDDKNIKENELMDIIDENLTLHFKVLGRMIN